MATLDIRSIPDSFIQWPSAYRLRPTRMPTDHALHAFDDDQTALDELIAFTSPIGRWKAGKILLDQGYEIGTAPQITTGFSTPYPEWRFNSRNIPHMVVANNIQAAIEFISELYGSFLKDTSQPECRMNFLLERYTAQGSFKDISDREVFSSCYSEADHSVPQQVTQDIAASDHAGLIYDSKSGLVAVITKATALKWHGQERALTLHWNGTEFTQMFDYRDLYWRELGIKTP